MSQPDAQGRSARTSRPSSDGVRCPKCGCPTLVNDRGHRWCTFIGGVDVAACAWGCDVPVHWPEGQPGPTVVEAAPATAPEERAPDVAVALELPVEHQLMLAASGEFSLLKRYSGRIDGDSCIVCFCTEDHACEGGCSWAEVPPQLLQLGAAIPDGPVCSACADALKGVEGVEGLVRKVGWLRLHPWCDAAELAEMFGGEVAGG